LGNKSPEDMKGLIGGKKQKFLDYWIDNRIQNSKGITNLTPQWI